MDLFGLSVFFCHFTPREATLANSHMLAQMYTLLLKREKENSFESITWIEIEKVNVQAKTVHSASMNDLTE